MKALTTGKVAAICQVSPRMVAKWIDSGRLKGYKLPGSQDRRVLVEDLREFMDKHGMDFAIPGEEIGQKPREFWIWESPCGTHRSGLYDEREGAVDSAVVCNQQDAHLVRLREVL